MRIAAVVVTHRRPELLLQALERIREQTRRPDVTVVVENDSGDDTARLVRENHPEVVLRTTSRNVGGAGGFALGIEEATKEDIDALWLMDDDTLPRPGALEALAEHWEELERPAVLASRVVWKDGSPHPMNTPRRRPGGGPDRNGCTPIRSASFVSLLVSAEAVRRHGLPLASYFLWNDDFEYTTRLLKGEEGWLCPESVVEHHTERRGDATFDPGERFYYEVRNKLWMLKHSRSLSTGEKALYAGRSLVRWAQTLRRASNRRLTLRAGLRGLGDGIRTRPAPNEQVLEGAV